MHRNTVYGHVEWKLHKSSWRHANHILSIPTSGIIGGLGPPVMLSTIGAVFVTLINYGVMHKKFAHWVPRLEISSLPFTLIAPFLALLLVFRTNSSYNRFDEARKAWGSNVNRCRDLVRQALTWIRAPEDAIKLRCLSLYIKAYPYYLKDHLTDGDFPLELNSILSEEEINSINSAKNRPIHVLQVLSELINQCKLLSYDRVSMDLNLTQFHDNVGACERLFKTPIPVAYTRMTSRMLILWHLALPYGLWAQCGWLTIPATFMSSAALFYIEQVGVMIEEPFWILALDSICGGITAAVEELCCTHNDAVNLALDSRQSPSSAVKKTSVLLDHVGKKAPDHVMKMEQIREVEVSAKGDHVMLIDRSKSHDHRGLYGDGNNVMFSRLKSVG